MADQFLMPSLVLRMAFSEAWVPVRKQEQLREDVDGSLCG